MTEKQKLRVIRPKVEIEAYIEIGDKFDKESYIRWLNDMLNAALIHHVVSVQVRDITIAYR